MEYVNQPHFQFSINQIMRLLLLTNLIMTSQEVSQRDT